MSSKRRVALILLALLVFCLFAVAAATTWFLYLNQPGAGIWAGDYTLKIQNGETVTQIADRLEATGVIRSSLVLRLVSRALGTENQFIAGYYRVPEQSSLLDVHSLLVSGSTAGNQNEQKVTVPEGWTITKIANRLETLNISTREDFVKAARSPELIQEFGIPADTFEGYLFPDTYFFPREFPAEAIVDIMARNFFEHLTQVAPDFAQMPREEMHRRIVMASIVEREYRVPDEAPLIASVFYNRLSRNIGLESCATLEYIITEILGEPHPEYITLEDKNIESDYNTYKWAGLPPGPISNPGAVALHAAFHPAETDYWYFLLKDRESGEHYFSRDLEEHNQAKVVYLKRVGSGE